MHNYIWCPYYLPSFMKFCSVVSEELCWQIVWRTDGEDKNNMSPHIIKQSTFSFCISLKKIKWTVNIFILQTSEKNKSTFSFSIPLKKIKQSTVLFCIPLKKIKQTVNIFILHISEKNKMNSQHFHSANLWKNKSTFSFCIPLKKIKQSTFLFCIPLKKIKQTVNIFILHTSEKNKTNSQHFHSV